MSVVVIYTSALCGYCMRAKQLLDSKSVVYEEFRVDQNPEKRIEMTERSKRRTVPQIFIANQHIGGCDDLFTLERSNRLDDLLRDANQPS